MYFYVFDYSLQFISSIACILGMTSTSCWYLHVVLNARCQFQVIQIRIRNFHKTKCVEEQEKIVDGCIADHQELLEFCEIMELVFSKSFLTECICITVFICCSGFGIKMFPDDYWMYGFFSVCILASTFETFCFCFIANLVTTESSRLAEAAYDSEWYGSPVTIQKKVLLMIVRAQKPVYITAGSFMILSLELFETIFRTAASYFTVLNSMSE